MTQSACITLIDADAKARDTLADHLRAERFDVAVITSVDDPHAQSAMDAADCVILSLSPGGRVGIEAIRSFRSSGTRPIIALSGPDQARERAAALENGADDAVERDTHPREVSARVRALLRRMSAANDIGRCPDPNVSVLRFGRWSIDLVQRRVVGDDGDTVTLTAGEFDILKCFVRHPLRPLSRLQILEESRNGTNAHACYARSIDVLIGRIRGKIEEDPADPQLIRTVRGTGYVFTVRVFPA